MFKIPDKLVYDIIAEPQNMKTRAISEQVLLFVSQMVHRSGKSSLKLLDETISTSFLSLQLTPFDPWFEQFDESLLELLAAGIVPK